jgi:hypothetical protein
MTEASSEHGTVLPRGSSALIVSDHGELSMFLADLGDDAPVPRLVQLLVAVLLRSTDEEWVEDMLADLDDRRQN